MDNDIFPTTYGRTDGQVTAFKYSEGWVLRSVRGPAWFWNHQTGAWDISIHLDLREPETAARYLLPMGAALKILPTLAPV
jgi:hypothetical protein